VHCGSGFSQKASTSKQSPSTITVQDRPTLLTCTYLYRGAKAQETRAQDDMVGTTLKQAWTMDVVRVCRRTHISIRMSVGAILVFACCSARGARIWSSSATKLAPPPSILLITLDTVRADHLGCYGYSRVETPNIDQLAADGIRFASSYTQVPITLPAHAVILTGTYPMFNGVRDFTSSGLAKDVPTIAEILRHNGYHTAAFVSSFVLSSMWGLDRGFDLYDDHFKLDSELRRDLFLVTRGGDQTVDRLLEWLDGNSSRPFFVWLHLYDAHSPYYSPEPFRSRYAGRPYDGAIAFDDEQVGRVMARLRALNLYDSTLVALVSDHGESLGEHQELEHGFFIYNATLHVPLIVKLPKSAAAPGKAPSRAVGSAGDGTKAQVVTHPVSTVDLAPTVGAVAGIPPAEMRSFQGRSLLPERSEAPRLAAPAVYAESYYARNSCGWHELRALITSQFQYIDAPQAELYDLQHDPGERSNIISGNSAVAAALHNELLQLETKFATREKSGTAEPLDPETLEKLKSLGYVSYTAGTADERGRTAAADPKDKIVSYNRMLRAGDLTRAAKYVEADQLLARLEQEEPDLYVVPFARGENYLGWGKPQPAMEEFRKSLSRNPTFDQAALGLGRACFLTGQDQQAVTALEVALRLNPRNFLARLALAKVYWSQNLPEKARPELEEVIKAHPDFAEAHANYGIILAKLRDYRQALGEIQQGIKLGYSDPIAYNYLGVSYAELGDAAEAVQAYQKAVELNPRYAAAHLNLALQYLQHGESAKAQESYRKVCAISDEVCRQYAQQFSARH
jgi:arylsulfatase A-like enzyme/Tfp pilus assembly protein PilF